jgi:eukaryotic-like serine/threonine-protein kinase
MVPQSVGRYELLKPLGAGGMGEVFLGRDTRLDRLVAIKRVLALEDPGASHRIAREARIVAQLNHPNIATVFDVVDHDGLPHIVMEYVEGATLASCLRASPLSEAQAVGYARQIADALSYAHAHGIVHCDIKPSNIMINVEGLPKVLDFGIARRAYGAAGSVTTTSTAVLRGTPPYMAPEVLLGHEPDERSDVYGLGVLIYEMIAAKRPFEGHGVAGIIVATAAPPVLLDRAAPGVSHALSALVARAIAADPTARVQSAREFKTALERLDVRSTASVPVRTRATPTTHARHVALALALTLACGALIAGLSRLSPRPQTTPAAVLGVMVSNATGDPANEYLASGLSDVLVSQLAGAPGLSVVPRTAVMPYLGENGDTAKAVRELGLTHILTASVQRAGPALLLAVSLASDRGRIVRWSGTFDGAVADFFHLEQRIGAAALKALRAEGIVGTETLVKARERPPTTNQDAFDEYSHGRALFERADVPGNLDRALTLFERAIARDRSFVRAHAALGEAQWAKYRTTRDTGWIDRARAATLEALRLDPDDPSVLYSLAVIDQGTGRIDDAIAGLERLLHQQPSSDEAHRLLGRIYEERSQFDLAIAEFREALRIRPDYPATIRALGLAYLDRGWQSEAIASFTTLTQLQPDNTSTFQLLGAAYQTAGDLDRALIAYQRVNAISPRPIAYSNIGVIHHTRGDYQAAADAYRQALALQPREPVTHRNLADALWMAGDRVGARAEYQLAIELATEALAINSSNARTHALIALCQAKLGRFDAARESMARAVQLAPKDSEVAYKQAVIATLAGQLVNARESLERAFGLGYSRSVAAADRDLDALNNPAGNRPVR